MSLWESQYAPGIKELLKCLEPDIVQALATNVSNNHITITSTEEAIEVVLRFTENVGKLFSYRRITAKVLYQYLYKKRLPLRGGESKWELVERVKKDWEDKYAGKKSIATVPHSTQAGQDDFSRVQATPTPSTPPAPTSINININNQGGSIDTTMNLNVNTPGVEINLGVTQGDGVRSDVFSEEFCKWFYTILNRLQPQRASLAGDIFSADVFMANCSLDVYLCGPQTVEKHATGKQDVYLLVRGICLDHSLCFVPHLDTGVKAVKSQHGLLKIFCCGILHQGDSMVGVFEQEFGLVRCPEGKWKILMTKVNLKQVQSNACLPTLDKEPVFEIL